MTKDDYNAFLLYLNAYKLDLFDRQRHAMQTNQDPHLTEKAVDYLRARGNDASQIIVDIESELQEAANAQ